MYSFTLSTVHYYVLLNILLLQYFWCDKCILGEHFWTVVYPCQVITALYIIIYYYVKKDSSLILTVLVVDSEVLVSPLSGIHHKAPPLQAPRDLQQLPVQKILSE